MLDVVSPIGDDDVVKDSLDAASEANGSSCVGDWSAFADVDYDPIQHGLPDDLLVGASAYCDDDLEPVDVDIYDLPPGGGRVPLTAKPVIPEGAKDFKPGFKFKNGSSVARGTSEVESMTDAHANGRPLAIYEILQGMVEFGIGRTPPPRIRIVYKNGEFGVFDGSPAALTYASGANEGMLRNDIEAVEFFNSGPGLKPEELTIFRHGDGGENLLGMHGRGTSIALTYLKSVGLDIDVTSNCYGSEWKAKVGLESTTTGLDKVLTATGRVIREVASTEAHTVFRVSASDPYKLKKFCGELMKASNLFLYANPKFPKQGVVPSSIDIEAERAKLFANGRLRQVAEGEVMCIEGLVDDEKNLLVKGLLFMIAFTLMV